MKEQIFNEKNWIDLNSQYNFKDITFHKAKNINTVRIAINRPEVRNAFRPQTVDELYIALNHAACDASIGSVLLTGNGPSLKDGGWAFSSGGDQQVRGVNGYEYTSTVDQKDNQNANKSQQHIPTGRLHILEVQRLIRFMPKIVIALVPGWAVGGGHSLHVVCDLTIASKEHAIFKQTDPDVSSFDGGFGSAYLARQIGQKRAREIFFLGKNYDAQEAFDMGMVNKVVPHLELENEGLLWAFEMSKKSPTAMKMLKYSFNLIDDGLIGQQIFAGEATRMLYSQPEAKEGRDAFVEKRPANYSQFPYHY